MLVSARRLIGGSAEVTFGMAPGDRALVAAGETVVAGAPIVERIRDAQLIDQLVPASADPKPGGRVHEGELLFEWRERWRVAGGEVTESLDSPVTGIVREVRPGSAIVIQASGRTLHGIVALGGPTRGRLHIAAGSDGELRSGGLDVGLAGTILVVGSRIDAETLTRARAMGVRGIIVGGLASKERRDFTASERRQRAALHRLPPYAVLVLEGADPPTARRAPSWTSSQALEGHEVAVVGDPPMLVFDARRGRADAPVRPRPRSWRTAGRARGDLGRPRGPRRFAGGVHLEAGIGAVRGRDGRGGPDRRPRAVRLTVPAPAATVAPHRVARTPPPRARLGRALGAVAQAGDLVCLWGDLGAGKTHLAKAFGSGLGVTETITSPSFVLMAEYARPAAAVPHRPVSPASARGRAGRRADRRAPARGRHARRVARAPGRRAAGRPPGRPDRRDRGRAAHDHADRRCGRLPPLPGRGRVTGRTTAGGHAILAIDTATTRIVIATGSPGGVADGISTWPAGYRHGETLLPSIGRFLGEQNIRRSRLDGHRRRHRARVRSPDCASASRRPRGWPTAWGSRSSGSRPRRRCSRGSRPLEGSER